MPAPLEPLIIPSRSRRVLAYVYELLPVLALLLVASAVALAATGGAPIKPGSGWFRLYLLAWCFGYFGISWRRGGQTLAMRPWRLHVRRTDGGAPRWTQITLRFSVALLGWAALGLGHLWVLIDPQRRAWHDLATATVVVQAPKVTRS